MTSSRRDIVLPLPHVCLNRLGFFCPLCLLRQRITWRTGKANGNLLCILELSCELWPFGQESPTLHLGPPLDDWHLKRLFVCSSWAITAHPSHSEVCTHVQEHKTVMIHLIQRHAHMSKNTKPWLSTSLRGVHTCPRTQNPWLSTLFKGMRACPRTQSYNYPPRSEVCTHVQEHKTVIIHLIQRRAHCLRTQNPDAMSFPFRMWFWGKKSYALKNGSESQFFLLCSLLGPTVAPLVTGRALSEWGMCKWLCIFNQTKQYLWESKSGQNLEQLVFPKEVGDPLGDLVKNSFKNVFVRLKF